MNTTKRPLSPPSATYNKTPAGPRGNLVLGSAREFLKDPLGFVSRMAREHGDVAHYRMLHTHWYQVNHPAGIQRILQDNHRNYSKGAMTTSIMQPLLGNGLVLSEGDFWLKQRRLMQPTFHRKSIAAFGSLMTRTAEHTIENWDAYVGLDRTLDVAGEMMRLTLDIVTESLFSTHISQDVDVIGSAISTVLDDIGYRFQMPLYPPPWVPTPHNRRRNAALQLLDQTMYRIIDQRRQHPVERHDLLALLMETRDADTGEAMSDKQLRDEVITLFGAGHETTAVALTWTWYLLATHPQVERRLHAELSDVLGGRAPTVDDLSNLPYTGMVIDETLRLYPPAWITNRQLVSDDEICGYHFPANAFVVVSPFVMHRHPAYWDDPDVFNPERFAPEYAASRPPYIYFPFGGGPRQCIGKAFALIEMKLVLATIDQRYRLLLQPGQIVEPLARATLRPRGGLQMIVQAR